MDDIFEPTVEEIDNLIDPALAAADAQAEAATNAYLARQQQQRASRVVRGRSETRTNSATAGSRRAASAPADTRQPRRQRTNPPRSTATPSGASATAAAEQAMYDTYQAAEHRHQAAENEQAEQERADAAEAARQKAAAEKRKHAQRKQDDYNRWHDCAPRLTTAVLQLHAAPDPAAECCFCQAAGCTIRYGTAACPIIALRSAVLEFSADKHVKCWACIVKLCVLAAAARCACGCCLQVCQLPSSNRLCGVLFCL
jgi:hypothetical protein